MYSMGDLKSQMARPVGGRGKRRDGMSATWWRKIDAIGDFLGGVGLSTVRKKHGVRGFRGLIFAVIRESVFAF